LTFTIFFMSFLRRKKIDNKLIINTNVENVNIEVKF